MSDESTTTELIESPSFIKTTRCYGAEFLALCEREKNKEIWIYSIEVGSTLAEWIVEWSERKTHDETQRKD